MLVRAVASNFFDDQGDQDQVQSQATRIIIDNVESVSSLQHNTSIECNVSVTRQGHNTTKKGSAKYQPSFHHKFQTL